VNRSFLLLGFSLLWSGVAAAQEVIFENSFENHPDAVEILSFISTPGVITEGDSSTLSWTLKDATACTPSGGNAEWQGLVLNGNDSSFEFTNLAEGAYSFTLTCTGPIGDPAVAVAQIVVEAPLVCEPPDLTGATETISWLAFWLADFPDINLGLAPGGEPRDSRLLQIFGPGFRAIEFNTADVIDTGLFESPDNQFVSGPRLGVLSKCLGRFDNVPAACEFVWTNTSGGITWSTENAPGACQLDADTTYYLNVTFTDGVDPDSTSCDANEDCYATIKHNLIP
jgi:hypothetical protein